MSTLKTTSNKEFLPFAKPSINQAAIDEVVACLQSGWLTTGPRVKQFEQQLQDYLQTTHALALSSATAGLHIALKALNLKPGDEIIVPAMTFVASLNTIVLAGAKPVVVDVDQHTLNIDTKLLEQAITSNTKAIMPVHFAGLPVDLEAIYTLAGKHKLRVIEDAAHAIGSYYQDKIIGSFGDIQVFSFHPNKNMTTGEGGCVTTKDDQIAKYIQQMRFHGIDRDAFNRFSKEGSQHYDVVAAGFKYNMMDIQAALGIHQLPQLDSFIEKRTRLAQRYLNKLSDWDELLLPQQPAYNHRHAWHLFTPLINTAKTTINRDEFIEQMKQQNIGTGLHYPAVHLYSYYQKQYGYKVGDFPNAEFIGERIVSLPLFPDMTEADQDRVINTMRDILKKGAA